MIYFLLSGFRALQDGSLVERVLIFKHVSRSIDSVHSIVLVTL